MSDNSILGYLRSFNDNFDNYYSTHQNSYDFDKSIQIISQNIRSITKNLRIFKENLETHELDPKIILFQETWNCSGKKLIISLDGYIPYFQNRPETHPKKRGGGLGIFIKKELPFKLLDGVNNPDIEIMSACTKINSRKVVIINVYRPPEKDIKNGIELLSKYINSIRNQHTNFEILMLGDMNIDINTLDSNSKSYLHSLINLGLMPLITNITRKTHNSETIIDHIFSEKHWDTGILEWSITDHYAIVIKTIETLPNLKKDCLKRMTKDANIADFKRSLETNDWMFLYDTLSPYDKTTRFFNEIDRIYNDTCPIKKCCTYKKTYTPWLTTELKNMIKNENKLYRKMRKKNTITLINKHIDLKKKLIIETRKAYNDYWKNRIYNCGNNSKKNMGDYK